MLVRRQEAARRPHPLQGGGRLLDGLAREREVVRDLRGDADVLIDTIQPQRPPAHRQVAEAFGTAEPTALRDHRGQLRLQVRHPGRRRLRGRHALPAQPVLGARAAPQTGRDDRVADYVKEPAGRPASSSTRYVPLLETVDERLPPGGQAVHDRRDRLHRRQAPQRRDVRGDRRAGCATRGVDARAPTATWGGSEPMAGPTEAQCGRRPRSAGTACATLSALAARAPTSSRRPDRRRHGGRQRRLVGPAARRVGGAPTRRPADGARRPVRRRRVGPHLGRGAPAPLRRRGRDARPRRRQPAHRGAVGAAGRPRRRLDWVGRLLGAQGRVLPMACPAGHRRRVRGRDPADRTRETVRGQVEVATTDGQVVSVELDPADPPACPEAIDAVMRADWVVLGPGIVVHQCLPHLLVPELRGPAKTGARRCRAQPGADSGRDRRFLARRPSGSVRSSTRPTSIDVVLADRRRWRPEQMRQDACPLRAELVIADVAAARRTPRHDSRSSRLAVRAHDADR